MIKNLAIILVFISIISLGCNEPYSGGFKDPPATCTSTNTVKLFPDALSRLYFKDSTYWIYQDSLSGLTDSVWVDTSFREVSNKYQSFYLYTKCYEQYGYTLKSLLNGRTRVTIFPQSVDDESHFEDAVYAVNYYPEQINHQPIFRFFIKKNSYINEDNGVFDTLNYIRIRGQDHYNVLRLTNPGSNYDIYKESYYSKDIGLIKYKMKDGSVWELLRYQLH